MQYLSCTYIVLGGLLAFLPFREVIIMWPRLVNYNAQKSLCPKSLLEVSYKIRAIFTMYDKSERLITFACTCVHFPQVCKLLRLHMTCSLLLDDT